MGNKLKNDLSGFEEVLDLVNEKKRGQREEKIGAEYDIQSFLELEKERLDKTYSFLIALSKVFNNHSQIKPLLEKSRQEITEKESTVINVLIRERSSILRNLEFLFDSFFPKP